MSDQKLYSTFHEDSFYQPLLEKFSNNIGKYINKLELAFQRRETEGVRNVAHEIKGVFGAYGFPKIAEVANTIQVSYQPTSEMDELVSNLISDLYLVQSTYPAAN